MPWSAIDATLAYDAEYTRHPFPSPGKSLPSPLMNFTLYSCPVLLGSVRVHRRPPSIGLGLDDTYIVPESLRETHLMVDRWAVASRLTMGASRDEGYDRNLQRGVRLPPVDREFSQAGDFVLCLRSSLRSWPRVIRPPRVRGPRTF